MIADFDLIPAQELSLTRALLSSIRILVTDILLYGFIGPVLGVYLAGSCTKLLDLGSTTELCLCVVSTYLILNIIFWICCGEYPFWKHLMSLNPFYKRLLYVRDAINVFSIFFLIVCLSSTVDMMMEDEGMKPKYVSEGASYLIVKTVTNPLHVEFIIDLLGLRIDGKEANGEPGMKQEMYEHGALYILLWGMFAAAIAKFLYFNTLFTMTRAIGVFLSLNPIFNDENAPSNDKSGFLSKIGEDEEWKSENIITLGLKSTAAFGSKSVKSSNKLIQSDE